MGLLNWLQILQFISQSNKYNGLLYLHYFSRVNLYLSKSNQNQFISSTVKLSDVLRILISALAVWPYRHVKGLGREILALITLRHCYVNHRVKSSHSR